MKILTLMEDTPGLTPVFAEHGLSLCLETDRRTVLLDTGASELTVRNAEALGADLCKVDTAVVSHGHYDHAGGLAAFARLNPRAELFMRAEAGGAFFHGEKYIGVDRAILSLPRLHLVKETGVTDLGDGFSLFAGLSGTHPVPRGNRVLTERLPGTEAPDRFLHEQCLAVNDAGKTYLFSGCAHNGILNILDRFEALYHTLPGVVVSGFHMMSKTPYTDEEAEEIRQTARVLSSLPTVFYTGHCTGLPAYELMKPILGDSLRPIHSGDRIL